MKYKLSRAIRKELAVLAAEPESEIGFSDSLATTEQDWHKAACGRFYRPLKQAAYSKNANALAWFKRQGKG